MHLAVPNRVHIEPLLQDPPRRLTVVHWARWWFSHAADYQEWSPPVENQEALTSLEIPRCHRGVFRAVAWVDCIVLVKAGSRQSRSLRRPSRGLHPVPSSSPWELECIVELDEPSFSLLGGRHWIRLPCLSFCAYVHHGQVNLSSRLGRRVRPYGESMRRVKGRRWGAVTWLL